MYKPTHHITGQGTCEQFENGTNAEIIKNIEGHGSEENIQSHAFDSGQGSPQI